MSCWRLYADSPYEKTRLRKAIAGRLRCALAVLLLLFIAFVLPVDIRFVSFLVEVSGHDKQEVGQAVQVLYGDGVNGLAF